MKVDSVKSLNTANTAAAANTQKIVPASANNAQSINTARQSDVSQIMQQHAQVSGHQHRAVSGNPNLVVSLFYGRRRLGDRSLSNIDSHSDISTMHPDVLEEVFGLLNGIKTSKQITAYTRKLFKRLGHTKNIIESNYEPESEDEKQELQNVKRKTTSKVTKEQVKDVIEEMLGKDPANSYILAESAKHELGLTGVNAKNPKEYTDLDKAIIEFSKENYTAHGAKIRADVNIANEIGQAKDKTQFKEFYYALIQFPQLTQLMDIHKVFGDKNKNIDTAHTQFMESTNLLSQAAKNDRDGEKKGRLPTSDPNTIHDVISVMDKRSKIDSLYHSMKKFKKIFGAFIGMLNGDEKEDEEKESNKKTLDNLKDYLINQRIKSKT